MDVKESVGTLYPPTFSAFEWTPENDGEPAIPVDLTSLVSGAADEAVNGPMPDSGEKGSKCKETKTSTQQATSPKASRRPEDVRPESETLEWSLLSVLILFLAVLNMCDVVHVMLAVLLFVVAYQYFGARALNATVQKLSQRVQELERENQKMLDDNDRWHEEEMNRVYPRPQVIPVPGPTIFRVPERIAVTPHGSCFHHKDCTKVQGREVKYYRDCFYCSGSWAGT